jgi:predicted transcriptional regulator
MYITKEELNERLKKTDIQIVERERKLRNGVNINNTPEKRLTDEERKAIAILANTGDSTNIEIAELMGVSPQTVSLAARGIKTVEAGVDQELKSGMNSGIEKIAADQLENNKKIKDQLLTNLSAALGHVANNLDNTDASEASKIALDMTKILDRVNGKDSSRGARTAIIINVPAMKDEKSYSTITV